jgi:hypothetical protein
VLALFTYGQQAQLLLWRQQLPASKEENTLHAWQRIPLWPYCTLDQHKQQHQQQQQQLQEDEQEQMLGQGTFVASFTQAGMGGLWLTCAAAEVVPGIAGKVLFLTNVLTWSRSG